jgi:hypothetical protein
MLPLVFAISKVDVLSLTFDSSLPPTPNSPATG